MFHTKCIHIAYIITYYIHVYIAYYIDIIYYM